MNEGLRADALDKTTGRALYTADVRLPGMLHAKVLRSAVAHGRLLRIDASRARAMPGVHAVLTRDDIAPGTVPFYGYFIKDQPIVALDRVRYEGDILAAVAAETEWQAAQACAAIEVEIEPLPPVATIEDALAPGAAELFPEPPIAFVPHYGEGASAAARPQPNVCFEFRYRMGDADAFARCDHVFEDEFRFSRMHHLHLEPFVSVADCSRDRIEIWSSCQNPFPLRKELSRMFGVPENRITVHVPYIGGGFGSKNNCKTEPVAVRLSQMTGRPVRFCLTMEEGFLTNTQHAAVLRLKTGVMADGTLVARHAEILLDAGAYSDASPLVAEKAGYRVAGPYRWQHVDSICKCVMTNTAPAGPFRGFGGTQAAWASESQIDMIARRLGIDPLEMRLKNVLSLGDPYMPGESAIDSDLGVGLRLVADRIGWHGKNRQPNRGLGIALGFKDGGGVNKPAQARVKVSTNGDIFLQCGTVELGQGAKTALTTVVAKILGAPLHRVAVAPINTDFVPFDQGTNASSAIAVMGQAVAQAATRVRQQVIEFAAAMLHAAPSEVTLDDWHAVRGAERVPLGPLVMRHFGGTGFEFSADGFFKAKHDERAPLETQCVFWEIGWAAVEVEVDPETGRVTIPRLVVSGDAGRALHKAACRGQDEGAAMMGLGQALFERMVYDGTTLLNGEALEYRAPLAEDLPAEFVSITQEQGHGPGPFGAKGMGEGAMLPIAAAVANAIEDAVGVRITELPITPERVLMALQAKQESAA
jgi:CO/xanthine dehydrogenase Mo-binding subunit